MAESYKGEAYCVKCKDKVQFEGSVKVSDSGRRMAQGICPKCGTKVNRILGKA
jgi:Zn finger protein HypA/HybF involved in hydrogenase expression